MRDMTCMTCKWFCQGCSVIERCTLSMGVCKHPEGHTISEPETHVCPEYSVRQFPDERRELHPFYTRIIERENPPRMGPDDVSPYISFG